jgi:tryptophanyl-tRNA synthetase
LSKFFPALQVLTIEILISFFLFIVVAQNNFSKPNSTYFCLRGLSVLVPGQETKLSASDSSSAIYVDDSPATIKKKVF